MLIGRFLMIVPLLAIAGSLAAKRKVPPSLGTFPSHRLRLRVAMSHLIARDPWR